MSENEPKAPMDDDVKLLHSMGYAQELSRRMSAFSNFAISFSIICILAGGITAFPGALGAAGGISIGLGWPLGAAFALVVAAAMAQIASSYPTAGGLYHWSSILGGKGFGWATAWFNLLGLVFVVSSVNFGVWDPFFKTLIAPLLGIDPATLGWGHQTVFIALITASQCWLNHYAPRLTTKIIDLSGYLIFILALLLVVGLLAFGRTHELDFSRLFSFQNFTGAEGSWWPENSSSFAVFLSGLLLTVYTITGFDASAHTSEETHNAARNVPRGILSAVLWSALFGYIMICTFLLVIPDLKEAVKQGLGFFEAILAPLPTALRVPLGVGIFLVNYVCALAGLMSTSRMVFAFARDGGLPASGLLRGIHHHHRTPGAGIWVSGVLAFASTLYGDAFVVLSTACAVFLYISYIMPVAAGFLAEGKTWTRKGPFDLGTWSKPVAIAAVIGGAILVYVGVQPPNEKVLYLVIALSVLLLVFWWGLGIRTSFQGPPMGERIGKEQQHIRQVEAEEAKWE